MTAWVSNGSLVGTFASTVIPALALASTASLDAEVAEVDCAAETWPSNADDGNRCVHLTKAGVLEEYGAAVGPELVSFLDAVAQVSPRQRVLAVDIFRKIRASTATSKSDDAPDMAANVDDAGALLIELSAPRRRLGFRIPANGQVRWMLVDLERPPWLEAAGDMLDVSPVELMKRLRMA